MLRRITFLILLSVGLAHAQYATKSVNFVRNDATTCAAGQDKIWVDLSELKLKVCENGVTIDLLDAIASAGTGTMTSVKIDDVLVGAADAEAVDFGTCFDAAAVSTDRNVTLDLSECATGGDLTWVGNVPTIGANSVALGTDTTGNYAASSSEGGPATSVAANSVALTTGTTGNYAAGDAEAGNATGVACTTCVDTGDVAADAITYAKIQNVTDARLLGRSAGSSGDAQEITVGSGLSLAAGALTATGGGSGTVTSAKEAGALVGTADAAAFDFGSCFDVAAASSDRDVDLDLSECTSGDVTYTGNAAAISANAVALTTDTTGDYVSDVTANQGLLKTGTEAATLGLVDCAASEILKRNVGDTAWECSADSGAAGGDSVTVNGAAVTDPDFIDGDIEFDVVSDDVTGTIGAGGVDAITDLDASIKTGVDAEVVTGTAGADGNLAVWNADGDVVDGGAPSTGGAFILHGGTGADTVATSGGPFFIPCQGIQADQTSETSGRNIGAAGQTPTYSNLGCRAGNALASGSYAVVLRDNGADTAVACTIDSANQTCTDTVDSEVMTSGGSCSIKITPSSPSIATTINCGLKGVL